MGAWDEESLLLLGSPLKIMGIWLSMSPRRQRRFQRTRKLACDGQPSPHPECKRVTYPWLFASAGIPVADVYLRFCTGFES